LQIGFGRATELKVRDDELDGVWKALSDSTRRSILDLLRQGPRTTTQIVEAFPQLSRFGVMKHIDVLREAGLVHTREERRQRINSLNVVPIRQIYERWVGRFEELWASHLLRVKEDAEAIAGEAALKQAQPPRAPAKKRLPKA
jgi:DNA-binding transcriptional ArsR family regulator